jgi:signal transduction histidine kinase
MDVAVPTAPRLHAARELRRAGVVAGGFGIAGLTAAAAALGASAPADHSAMNALLRGAMVAAPLAAGVYASRVPAYGRFAGLLAAVGLTSFATTLAESPDATLYSVGRTAGWTLEVLLVVVLLAFPTGRLAAPVDRWLTAAMAVILVTFYLPTLLLAEHFRVPSPYTSCTQDCPVSVFFLLDGQHPAVGALLSGTGSLLVFAVMLAVVVRLQQRISAAGPLGRQMLVPVLAIGMVRVTLVGCAVVGRDVGGATVWAQRSAWMIAWATPLIALAFLVGVVRSRLFAERALRRLATCVRSGPDVPALERAFARAFDDASVEVVFPRGAGDQGWIDVHGDPVQLSASGTRRDLHVVHGRDGTPVAALACDEALSDRPDLLDAAADLAAVALDNLRLVAEAEAAAHEARESRARIAAAAEGERRRIERDLHDGAQQRLVALRIELGLVEDLALRDPERCASRIRELEDDVDDALEDLRSLAHGVCPPLLADRGLVEALQAAASRSAAPVALEVEHVGRYSPEVESAIYFCVLEALQNVGKHARGARRVVVRLTGAARDELCFSVRDDGAGAPGGVLTGGAGVTNMQDRIGAIGGELRLASRPGLGTEVRGRVPVACRQRVPAQVG